MKKNKFIILFSLLCVSCNGTSDLTTNSSPISKNILDEDIEVNSNYNFDYKLKYDESKKPLANLTFSVYNTGLFNHGKVAVDSFNEYEDYEDEMYFLEVNGKYHIKPVIYAEEDDKYYYSMAWDYVYTEEFYSKSLLDCLNIKEQIQSCDFSLIETYKTNNKVVDVFETEDAFYSIGFYMCSLYTSTKLTFIDGKLSEIKGVLTMNRINDFLSYASESNYVLEETIEFTQIGGVVAPHEVYPG